MSLVLRGVFGVLLIAALAAGVLAVRLSQGPISLPGLSALIERQVNSSVEDAKISIGDLILSLGDGKVRSGLQFVDVEVRSIDDEALFSAPRIAAAFQLGDVLQGRVQPTRVTIVEPELVFVRGADGRVQVGMGSTPAFTDDQPTAAIDDQSGFDALSTIVDGFVGDVESSTELSKLDLIQVVEADLTYDDRLAGRKWRTRKAGIRISRYARGARAVLTIDDIDGQTSGLSLRVLADRPRGRGDTLLTLQFGRVEGRELARQAPGLEWLEFIDGTIEGRASAVLEQSGEIRDLSGVAVLEDGALDLDGEAFPYDFARLAFDVDTKTRTLDVKEFAASAKNLGVRMSAVTQVQLDDAGDVSGIALEAKLERLAIALPRMFEEDLQFGSGSLTASWDRTANAILVKSADLQTQETTFSLSGRLQENDASWTGDLRVSAVDAPISDILHIWPLDAATSAREWVDENIIKARIRELLMQARFGAGEPRLFMDFSFEDLDARYIGGMSPLRSLQGEAFLGAERLDLRVDDGFVAPNGRDRIALGGSRVSITDFSAEVTNANIYVDGSGKVASVLDLIDQPPLSLVRKLGVDLGEISGATDVEAEIAFPVLAALTLEQIDVAAAADLKGLGLSFSPTERVKLALAGERLALNATTSELSLEGALSIDGVPSTVNWREYYGEGLGSRTLNVTSTGNPELLERFGLEDPPLAGEMPFDLTLTQTEGQVMQLEIDADLTQASVSVPGLGWEKSSGESADLLVNLEPGERLSIKRIRLDTPDLDIDGSVELDGSGAFAEARFQRLNLRKTFDISATLKRSGATGYDVSIAGDYIDIGALLDRLPEEDAGSSTTSPPLEVRFEVDRLIPTEDLRLENATGRYQRSAKGDTAAEVFGALNGKAGVTATLSTRPNGQGTVVVESPDAAAVLAAAEIYEDAEGGNLTVTADLDADSNLNGIVRIQDLSVTSDESLQTVLLRSGVDDVETEIETGGLSFRKIWIPFRTTDDEIVLTDAIASSSALAVKVNGTIDPESGDLDLRGVISPAYGLTGALDNVPLLGTLLSGGEGEGILAMTFTLSGAAKDPDFSLNPLSLLTPGFLRNVFEGNSSKPSEGFTERLERQDQ